MGLFLQPRSLHGGTYGRSEVNNQDRSLSVNANASSICPGLKSEFSFYFFFFTGNDLSSLQIPVNRSDGSKCSGVEEILERWREHYDQTLNHPSGTVCSELNAASSAATPDIDICTDEPTLDEVM